MGDVFNLLFRVFGSGFLSHQGSVTEVQLVEKVDTIVMIEQSLDIRVELFQQHNVNVSMGIQVKKKNNSLS